MSKDVVGVSVGGEVEYHMPDTTGHYATLCGLDGWDPDPSVDQRIVKTPIGQKIDCAGCWHLWEVCHQYEREDFING